MRTRSEEEVEKGSKRGERSRKGKIRSEDEYGNKKGGRSRIWE